MQSKGTLVVISGPSGSGKGTVVKRLREIMPEVSLSVSATTRAPREGEMDGREYYFVSRETFEGMIADGEILEYTTYCENYYGTPMEVVLYQDKDGNTISTKFVEDLDPPPQGFKRIRCNCR